MHLVQKQLINRLVDGQKIVSVIPLFQLAAPGEAVAADLVNVRVTAAFVIYDALDVAPAAALRLRTAPVNVGQESVVKPHRI